jgi:hypothetical protein
MLDYKISSEAAEETGVAKITATKWAEKNGVEFIGVGKGKTYLWTKADIARFQARDTKRGRRWHKTD